jgi:hypothetical protein
MTAAFVMWYRYHTQAIYQKAAYQYANLPPETTEVSFNRLVNGIKLHAGVLAEQMRHITDRLQGVAFAARLPCGTLDDTKSRLEFYVKATEEERLRDSAELSVLDLIKKAEEVEAMPECPADVRIKILAWNARVDLWRRVVKHLLPYYIQRRNEGAGAHP